MNTDNPRTPTPDHTALNGLPRDSFYTRHQNRRTELRAALIDALRTQIRETLERGGNTAHAYAIALNLGHSELMLVTLALADLQEEFSPEDEVEPTE